MAPPFSLISRVAIGILILLSVACASEQTGSADSPGTLDVHSNMESEFVSARTVTVWLPPGYDSTISRGYPVLYMHDGQNLFRADSANFGVEWQVEETLARLIDDGVVAPVIVVGIHSTNHRMQEYLPERPFRMLRDSVQVALRTQVAPEADTVTLYSNEYLRFLVRELKPMIDSVYRTAPGSENTYVAGSSMGGLISLYAIAEYPEVFGGAAALSTHWALARSRSDTSFTVAFREYLDDRLSRLRSKRLYFDHGTRTLDSLYGPHQAIIDSFLREKEFPDDQWTSRRDPGAAHHERAWAARFDSAATFLLPPPRADR